MVVIEYNLEEACSYKPICDIKKKKNGEGNYQGYDKELVKLP